MIRVFVHPNNYCPKLWAADPKTKEVIFGSITYRSGDERKMVLTGDISLKIKEKVRDGYEPIGKVETAIDVICLRNIFVRGDMGHQPNDLKGIVRCAEEILWMNRNIKMLTAQKAIEALKAETERIDRLKPEPVAEPINLSIVTPTSPNGDWDLVI